MIPAHRRTADPPAPAGRPLAELVPPFLQWLSLVRQRRPNTVRSYGEDLRTLVAFLADAGITHPQAVTFRHLEFFVGWLIEARHCQPQTANRSLHAARTFWQWLVREGLSATNPAADCFTLPTRHRLPAYLTVPQQDRLLAALARDESLVGQRDHALIATALFAGLRCSELANLRVEHARVEAGVLRVENGKGGRDRELPLVPTLAAILQQYLDEVRPRLLGDASSDYVFLRAKDGWRSRHALPLGTKAIWRLVRLAVQRNLGLVIGPHVLRHTFATTLHARGGDLALIQATLGHANPRTTMIYTHMASERMRADLTRLLEPRNRRSASAGAATIHAQKNSRSRETRI